MAYRCFHCGEKIHADKLEVCERCGYDIKTSSDHYFLFNVNKESNINLKQHENRFDTKEKDDIMKNVLSEGNFGQSKASEPLDNNELSMDDSFKTVSFYVKQGNYEQAYAWAKELAEMGHAKSAKLLGCMYELGYFVHRNYTKAFFWYSIAEKWGADIPADKLGKLSKMMTKEDIHNAPQEQNIKKISVAACYLSKIQSAQIKKTQSAQTKKDEAKASEINPKSEYLRGLACSRNGDYANMYKHMINAAEADYPDAMYYMGCIYEMGHYVAKDYDEAEKWYLKAAKYLPQAEKRAAIMNQMKFNALLRNHKNAQKNFSE